MRGGSHDEGKEEAEISVYILLMQKLVEQLNYITLLLGNEEVSIN